MKYNKFSFFMECYFILNYLSNLKIIREFEL